MAKWTTDNLSTVMPTQWGKLAVVTGATGGLGYETALALAMAGADVIVAGRNPEKGRAAVAKINAKQPTGKVRFELLDLADLKQISAFCEKLLKEDRPVDILVNNAGVMALPVRKVTADGFEMQFGTNHLGHFALTAQLLPLLIRGREPRVVNVSSGAHRPGRIDFSDLQGTKKYSPIKAYMQSKLANMLFTLELQKQSDASGWGLLACGAHPGYSRTDLIASGPEVNGKMPFFMGLMRSLMEPSMSQSAAQGALPQIYAATAGDVRGNSYWGPDGFMEMKGSPKAAVIAPQAKSAETAKRLWDESLALTRVRWQTARPSEV